MCIPSSWYESKSCTCFRRTTGNSWRTNFNRSLNDCRFATYFFFRSKRVGVLYNVSNAKTSADDVGYRIVLVNIFCNKTFAFRLFFFFFSFYAFESTQSDGKTLARNHALALATVYVETDVRLRAQHSVHARLRLTAVSVNEQDTFVCLPRNYVPCTVLAVQAVYLATISNRKPKSAVVTAVARLLTFRRWRAGNEEPGRVGRRRTKKKKKKTAKTQTATHWTCIVMIDHGGGGLISRQRVCIVSWSRISETTRFPNHRITRRALAELLTSDGYCSRSRAHVPDPRTSSMIIVIISVTSSELNGRRRKIYKLSKCYLVITVIEFVIVLEKK
jgi:hypothetical protein